jgi:hypothetical protein
LARGSISVEPLDHSDTTNPLVPATFVFVPYCTGDLHAGTATHDYQLGQETRTVAHVGGTNTQLFVDTLRESFPDARTIWVAGSSAGGYGATFNLHRFVAAYPEAAVHLMQDGAPFVPVIENYDTWQSSWTLAFPPGCSGCETSMPAVMGAVAAANPTSRIGLMHYDDDAVIKAYWGYADTAGSMVAATDELLADHYDQPTAHAFVLAGQGHTMLGQINTLVGSGGVRLSDWVDQWIRGDAAWATVR